MEWPRQETLQDSTLVFSGIRPHDDLGIMSSNTLDRKARCALEAVMATSYAQQKIVERRRTEGSNAKQKEYRKEKRLGFCVCELWADGGVK